VFSLYLDATTEDSIRRDPSINMIAIIADLKTLTLNRLDEV